MSNNINDFYRSNKTPVFEMRTRRHDDTSDGPNKMDSNDECKGSESSLESVDLDHNASETEIITEHSKNEADIPNVDAIDAWQNEFVDDTDENSGRESRKQCILNASGESGSKLSLNKTQPHQQCLTSKRTSLPVSIRQSFSPSQNSNIHYRQPLHHLNERHCQSIDEPDRLNSHRNSVFDDLLFEIYDRWHYGYKDSLDSDTFTDLTESDVVFSKSDQGRADGEKVRLSVVNLIGRDVGQLRQLLSELSHCSSQMSTRLIKQLKARERHLNSMRDKYDIMTAILHASSLKRREDSKIRFSIEPMPGEDAVNQWKDAMKAVARLPHGIPKEFRKKVWLALADNYLNSLCIDWEKTKRFTFNEKSNPDDSKLGLQIVKDLHRTGCSGFSGRDNDEDRAVLKRVLLAYARWNKHVGYCQGFNILAALILEVVDRQEDSALKMMIYLIDRVLPESYFANNLRSLSVDMAVFRNLLRTQLPELSRHLDSLQSVTRDEAVGSNYEPPLTNVFTMQWFLTMFATCLSKPTVLRVWDCILLDGSEILLRTAIVIWEKLQHRIMDIKSADEFYSVMGILSQEMLDDKLLDTEDLIKRIFSIAPFPLQHLSELREKFTYNITPFTNMMNASKLSSSPSSSSWSSTRPNFILDEEEDDDMMDGINCFSVFFPGQHSIPTKSKEDIDHADISKLSPGAYTAHPEMVYHTGAPVLSERVTLDVDMLRRQYKKLMHRQRQAHIILSAVQNKKMSNDQLKSQNTILKGFSNQNSVDLMPPAINHLFASRELLLMTTRNKKNQTFLPVTKMLQNGVKNKFLNTLLKSASPSIKQAFSQSRSCSVESSTGNKPSDDRSTQVEPFSSVASSSSMSVRQDDRSTKSDATCEPSQPWAESTQFDDVQSCETPNIRSSDINSTDTKQDSNDVKSEKCDKDDIKSVGMKEAGKDNKENDDGSQDKNMSFKEFIDSLPDESNPASKSNRYNRLQCFVENLKPIHHSSKSQKMIYPGVGLPSNSCTHFHVIGGTPSNSTGHSPPDDKPLQVFNPFPKKHFNSRRTQLGVQLGLYLSQNCSKVGSSSNSDTEMCGASKFVDIQKETSISKSYRNVCLHRQYLMGITKQSDHAIK